MMRQTISRLLDEWAPKGSFDFEEFASHFPVSVMFNLVGAPLEEVAQIRKDLETLGLAFSMNKELLPALQVVITRLEALVLRSIAKRRANPEGGNPDDVLDLLIRTGDQGEVTEQQLVDLIMFFFIAGYDTSKNAMTFTMHQLLQYPEIYERCAEDLDYCRKVVEEALRYYSPGSMFRFTNEDFVFRDVLLPKDTMIFFTMNISGRDPTCFEDADKFDPDRVIGQNQRHVAFGLGKHMCLGQFIARTQIQEGFHQIAQRLKNPRLKGAVGWRPYVGIWGLKGLPIEFTPMPAAQ